MNYESLLAIDRRRRARKAYAVMFSGLIPSLVSLTSQLISEPPHEFCGVDDDVTVTAPWWSISIDDLIEMASLLVYPCLICAIIISIRAGRNIFHKRPAKWYDYTMLACASVAYVVSACMFLFLVFEYGSHNSSENIFFIILFLLIFIPILSFLAYFREDRRIRRALASDTSGG